MSKQGGFKPLPEKICKCNSDATCSVCQRAAQKTESGDNMKKDAGKAPWHLAPWDAFRAIVLVLAFGAKKYRERGWEEGMAWSRVYSALQRHLTAWWMREGVDPDTGYSHLWHAGCCICFLIAYELRSAKLPPMPADDKRLLIAQDDRPLL